MTLLKELLLPQSVRVIGSEVTTTSAAVPVSITGSYGRTPHESDDTACAASAPAARPAAVGTSYFRP